MVRLIVSVVIVPAIVLVIFLISSDWSWSQWRENRRVSKRQLVIDDNYRAWQRAVWAVQRALTENDQLLLGMSTETVQELQAVIKEFRGKELSDGKKGKKTYE